jgi:hypothetical protein
MHVLDKKLSYEEVAEIFVRVNSLGIKLRGSDLALAQITSRWQGSLKLFEEFQEECEDNWFTLDLGLLVRALVVFHHQSEPLQDGRKYPTAEVERRLGCGKAGYSLFDQFSSRECRC